MKQGKLIRRAVSAALAGCMMFTLSAPALAESTDALMQLSMTRRSAVSVLDAENSGTDANASVATKYGITIEIYGRGKVEVDSDNCNNILGFLKYDPDKQKLTLLNSSASTVNYLTIDAPNTDVVLESTNMIVNFNLLIENARSVKVSSTGSWAPVYGKVFIYCACPVTLEHTGAGINHGVAISGIEFAAPVSASDFVYYTSDAPDATPTDAGTGTIPANTVNYLRIVPKVSYTITTADDATITVDGKAVTSVHEGEKVTVTAAGKENAEFTGWTAEGITLTNEQKAKPTVTFTMPGNNVTLNPTYKQYYTITSDDAAVIIKVDDVAADKALKGQTIKALAPNKKGYVFENWAATGVDLGNQVNKNWITFEMPESKVTLNPQYAKLHAIKVVNGTANITSAKEGTKVTVTAKERPGYVFDHWEASDGVELTEDGLTAKFTMPDNDVTITATYKKQRTVTVIGGTVNGTDSVTALREETVKIKAEYDPHEKKFDHWEVKGPKGWDLEDDQKTNPEFTLTVPKGNVTLTAVYNDYHNITVEGGYATPDRAIAGTQITLTPNLTFKMRDFDIKITAVPKQLYFVDLEDADTTANGEDTRVEVKTGEEVVLVAPEREGFRFNHWEVTSGTVGLIDADKTTAYFTMKSENVRIKAIYDEYHTITMVDGKGTAYDADGKEITSAVVGDKITIVANDRDSHEFNRWKIDPDNVILEDPNADKTAFIMPDEPVSVEAKYKHLQSITMNHGTAYDEDFSETDIAKAKQTITIKAEDRYADGLVFDHWAVDTDNVTLADEYGEKTTFEMVNDAVELTAHYKARVTVFSVPAKFEEGIGEHSDETWEKVGKTATITAEIDEETFPGMEFDYWEVIPTDLDIGDIHSPTISFEVPECEVKLVAHWKASGMNPIVDPDEDLDPDFDVDPVDDGSGAAGAIVAGAALGGAAVWGGYEIATRIILNDLLPAGAAIPANRGQLALLIWTEKGKPEPAAQPAFADITDAEQAKAAQWCVEQGTMDAKGDCFEPEGWTPKFKVIEVWNKAFPKQ